MSKPSLPMSEGRVAIIGGMIAGIGPLSLSLYTPALPEIGTAYAASDVTLRATLSVYFGGFAIAQLVGGPVSDIYGRKLVTLAFMSLYLLGSVGAALAPTIEILLAMRFLQGVGAAAGTVIARAIVRDVFEGDVAARVLNMLGIILSIGPSIAPSIGGLMILLAGWKSVFVLMIVLGIVVMGTVQFGLVETRPENGRDFRWRNLIRDYGTLLREPHFLLPTLVLCGTTVTFYVQATVMSLILVNELGYSAPQFGLGMLFITAAYLFGAFILRWGLPRHGAAGLLPIGIVITLASSCALAAAAFLLPPSLITVMLPVAFIFFGNAFILPAMYSASLVRFPHMAGVGASVCGFMIMATGFSGSLAAGFIPDPTRALGVIAPMGALLMLAAWLAWRRLPSSKSP